MSHLNNPAPSQEQLLDQAVSEPDFTFAAAQFAANAPIIKTADSWRIAHSDPAWPPRKEADVSRSLYEADYTRIGILRALEQAGVVCIPTSRRDVLHELTRGTEEAKGRTIRHLLRAIRDYRK